MKPLVSIVLLFTCLTAYSQTRTFSGTLTDSLTHKPVPFASVYVTASTDSVLAGVLATDKGQFQISFMPAATQSYTLHVTSLGYKPCRTPLLAGQTVYDLLLAPVSTQLQEVVVQGQRPAVEVDIDKLTYTPRHVVAGQVARDILNKTPMVQVSMEGEVRIRHSSKVQLLVDGKPISSEGAKALLRSLPGSAIKAVEVITTPSASADASGNSGGMLNIVLHRPLSNQYKGSVTAQTGTLYNHGLSLYQVLKHNRFEASLSTGVYTHAFNRSTLDSRRESLLSDTPYTLTEHTRNHRNAEKADIVGRMSYAFDTLTTLAATLQGGAFRGSGPAYRTYTATYPQAVSFTLTQQTIYKSPYLFGSLSFTRLTRKKNKWQLDANLSNGTDYTSIVSTQEETEVQNDFSDAHFLKGIVQGSYLWQLTTAHRLELGSKYSWRDYQADNQLKTGDVLTVSALSNHQQVWAAYGVHTWKGKTISVQYGLRAEYFQNQLQETNHLSVTYLNLFPSGSVFAKLPHDQSLRLAYRRSTQRPGIGYLNTFTDRRNPKDQQLGNPDLNPEFTQALTLDYTVPVQNWTFIVNPYYNQSNGVLLDYVRPLSGDTLLRTYGNFGRETTTGLDIAYTLDGLDGNLTISGDLNAYWYQIQSPVLPSTQGWVGMMSLNASYTWKGWTVGTEHRYQTPYIFPQYTQTDGYSLSVDVSKSFWNDRASIRFYARDLFFPQRVETVYSDARFRYTSVLRPQLRAFLVFVSYRFGKQFSTRTRREVYQEDVKDTFRR